LPYEESKFVGKSILKPDRDGSGKIKTRSNDAEIHDRWAQAIASAHELVHVAAKTGSGMCTMVIPIVVVPDGSLWKLEYDEQGRPIALPAQTEACEFFIGHKYAIEPEKKHEPVVLSHLHFLTLSGLKMLLSPLHPHQPEWDNWIPDKILEEYRSN
jgi:hypothetical protein